MKRVWIVLVGVMCVLLAVTQLNAQWLVYDASVLPSETGTGVNTLDLTDVGDNSPGPGFVQEIIDDPDITGNKLLKYLQPDGKTMYRYYFDESYSDSNFTLIARIKGEDDTYDRIFDLNWRNGNAGTRDELRISAKDSTLEIEKADIKVKVDMNLYEWHTYRIAVAGDEATVYVDENPIAVVSGVSTSSNSSNYIKIGDGSGDDIGGYLDWCILNMGGAYGPGEGPQIPTTLFVDGGNQNVPSWLVYDASVLPAETGGGGDTLDITNVADNSPGPGFVQEIIDDPDITGNKLLKYLQPDGKTMFRHYLDEAYEDSNMTFIIRIKGENDPETYDRSIDVTWHNGNAGTRDELRIWPADSTLELEKADMKVKLDVNFYEWHTFRIAITGDIASVYMDENETPLLSGTTTSSTSSQYIKFGDGSGDDIGGYVDWCILDVSGGYAPGEGLPIPGYLEVDTGPPPVVPHWLVYDGAVLPQETEDAGGDTLDISDLSEDSPGASFAEAIIDDPDITGNKLFQYLQPTPEGTRMYRYNFDESYEGTAFTMMARVRGVASPIYDRVFDLQWRNGNAGTRDELRIWPADSTLELEKAGVEVKVDLNLYDWHTYRIAVIGDSVTVFINERSTPYIAGTSTASTNDRYIKIGDGSSSDAVGGYLDWCIVDMDDAYEPGEGLGIPEELYVDPYVAPVEPGWKVYDASLLPTETEDVGGDSLDLSNLSQDSPGAGMVEEIMDDPDIPGNKIFKYFQPNGERMYRYYFPEGYRGKAYTMMARVKGENDSTYDRIFDLQWRNANIGSRDELRIWGHESKFELEKSNFDTTLGFNLFEWHTIRIAVSGDTSTIYVDEDPEPVMFGVSGESNSDNYVKIGDGGSDAIGGYLDWYILDLSGAYGPGEGEEIPEGLYVDVTTHVSSDEILKPMHYALGQNYPNPFNPVTTIPFQIPKAGRVTITLYNTIGQKVLVLTDKNYGIGRYEVSFDAARFSSGLYFYRIKSNDFKQVKKMMLLK